MPQRTTRKDRSTRSGAGAETTNSQHTCTHDLRRLRRRGLITTHVQHVLTATACDIARVADWLNVQTETL
ncbi:transposase [Streptomyces sp. NPDC046984]|uniref:transposase n=1 Tax=Streptomyces sp. NPDC046984 TaxID=3155138 RepID=UPI0033CAAA16